MFAPALKRGIHVEVSGSASGYNAAMTGATAKSINFQKAAGLAAAAVVILAGVMAVKFVKSAMDYQYAMSGVQAVTSATVVDFARLDKAAKELGRTTKFTMTEIAAGMEAVGRAGFSTNEIINSMTGITSLAAAANIDLATSADLTAKAIRALGLEASDSTRIADVFAKAAANSNVTVEMLGESMKYIAPLARAAGFSLEQTVGAIAKLGDVGIQGTMAGTGLRFGFSELLAETAGFRAKIAQLGLTMADFTGPNGELVAFTEILSTLSEAGADTGDIIELVGKRAGPAIAALVQSNPELKTLVDMLERSTGAAREMAAIRLATFQGQVDVLRGSWELLKVTIGEYVLPILTDLLKETIIPMVNEMAAWATENDNLKKKLEEVAIAISNAFKWLIDNGDTVIDALTGIGIALLVISGANIASGIVAATVSLKALFLLMAANPLFWPLLGIGAAIYAAPRIPDYYNLISGSLHKLDDKLTEGIFGPKSAARVTQAVVDFMSKGINDAETQLLASGTLSVDMANALAWDIASVRSAAMESLKSGMGLDFVIAEYKKGVEAVLAVMTYLKQVSMSHLSKF